MAFVSDLLGRQRLLCCAKRPARGATEGQTHREFSSYGYPFQTNSGFPKRCFDFRLPICFDFRLPICFDFRFPICFDFRFPIEFLMWDFRLGLRSAKVCCWRSCPSDDLGSMLAAIGLRQGLCHIQNSKGKIDQPIFKFKRIHK